MSAIPLRTDYDAAGVRRLARKASDADQVRRLLAIAAVYGGMRRAEAAAVGGMDRQSLCNWVHRFNADGPEGLHDRKPPGAVPKLTEGEKTELTAVVEAGPDPQADGVVRWRRIDLKEVIRDRFGVDYHERSVSRLLHELGFSHMSARPRHPGQDPEMLETFKKLHPDARLGGSPPAARHADRDLVAEPAPDLIRGRVRLGQKNGLVRQWARTGTRPRQPKDQRYQSAYLFGAVCPARGIGAAVVMPFADTHAMQAHLEEIGRTVAAGAHAVLLMDRAGWHTTGELKLPENITPVLLPPRSPELNPTENVWQYLRQTYLSNRVFDSYHAIIDAACDAWNQLIDKPWKIMSIGMREWAHSGQTQ